MKIGSDQILYSMFVDTSFAFLFLKFHSSSTSSNLLSAIRPKSLFYWEISTSDQGCCSEMDREVSECLKPRWL